MIPHRDIRCGTKPEGEAFDRVSRMKTNGPGSAPGRAHLPVSMDLGRVSPLNPHPSARENTARLMIRLTRRGGAEGEGGGWRVWRLSASSNGDGGGGGNTNRRNSFATFHFAARPLPHPELHSLSIISPGQATPCTPPLFSLFLAKEPYPRWRILPRVARRTRFCY